MKRLYLLIVFVAAIFVSIAGTSDRGATIPVDKDLRHGVLPNALHYYIRHNAKLKGQADFYIVSDVGAIQEDDDQQGLAHFMEHMAFNGTCNMPDKQIIEYLESIGVKFGANLNAYTSWDNTVYMMKDVPVEREMVVDSALLILHDWAGFIEPKSEEIDKERGVIKEELRTRDGADWRSTMSLIKALGRGTKYEHRNLIGYLEGLDSFEADVLVRFYHDWYRPDYQAIIIVGDIDVDAVESKVHTLFGDLTPPAIDAPIKDVIRVPDNDEPIIEIFSDPELQYSAVQYIIKREARDKSVNATVGVARENILDALIEQMQSARFDEVVMSENSPFLGASMSLGGVGVIPTLDATFYSAQSEEGELMAALREIVTQMERTRRYAFQEGEFERAKQNLLRSSESYYLNRNDRTNSSFVNRYISNYRFGTAIPSAEDEWQIDSLLIGEVTLDDVNDRVEELFSDNNHVVMLLSPKKEGLAIPTEAEVLSVIDEVHGSTIDLYEDKMNGEDLLPEDIELSGSEVVKIDSNEEYDTVEWRLANGVRVVVKPTILKADEVILSCYTDGGNSILSDDEYFSGVLLSSLLSSSGVGDYTAVELDRQLSGYLVSLNSWVSDYAHGFNGFATPSDVETLLQLLYLQFVSPRFDSGDFEIFRRQLRANVENQVANPDYAARQRFADVAFDGNIRKRPLALDDIDALSLDKFADSFDRLYSDADNFTFLIVGNVDLDSLKPLVEQYLGSLPVVVGDAEMEYKDLKIRPERGVVRDDFATSMEQPKVRVITMISNKGIDYTLQNRVVGAYFKSVLDDLLLKSVREELGGTYGVGVNFSIDNIPYERYTLTISYDTNEDQYELLQHTVLEQLEVIANEGATNEQMVKVREFMLKSFANSKEQNQGWLNYIKHYDITGESYISEYEAAVNSVTSDDVRSMARKILKDRSRIEVIMHPNK